MVKRYAIYIVFGLLLWPLDLARAHESRPLYVEINETAPTQFTVTWKVASSAARGGTPTIIMPNSCRQTSPIRNAGTIKSQSFVCKGNLSGETVRVRYERYNPSISTLFHLKRQNGESHTKVLGPDELQWTITPLESFTSVAEGYAALGIKHILGGVDHLLFVACLMFIAGTTRRVFWMITGFTVAHSITLALATLDVVRLPIPPTEAVIVLSILFLAVEIARNNRTTLTWRYPILVSSTFGLLHGFGFASVLSDIGLPQTAIPVALLFFNIGVEFGQIIFVLALVVGFALISFVLGRSPFLRLVRLDDPMILRPASYIVGIISAAWLYIRVSGFLA